MNEKRVNELKNELLDATGLQGVEHVQVAAESQAERLARLEDMAARGVTELGSIGTARYEVRSYPHPGKYEGGLVIDVFCDNADWFDDTAGDVSENGRHVGLLAGPFSRDELDKARLDEFGPLTEGEKAFLMAMKGALVSTDSQGFVNVSYALIDAEMQEIERDFDSVGQDDDQESYIDDEEFGDPGISHDDYPSKDLPRQEY